MGFKEKLSESYTSNWLKKYGDRLTQLQGRVLSIKSEEKSFLGIINWITVTLVLKQENSKAVATCIYKKRRWFKKPEFVEIKQGHSLVVQGLKPDRKKKKNKDVKEFISIMNVMNLTTKKDLVPVEGGLKTQRVRADRRFK
ncbi:hypothetical protein [Clostridium sp. UBA4548]|uniref:hypothetical protein n=1 Tax=Clostridium sp. UBA4548 TaxID=1946361 RepID=UPI0025BA518E|nr:hypothetical protein [Clostridium sp. UBA4548]